MSNSRKEFEVWASSKHFDLRRRGNGDYWTTDSNTQAFWLCWQAAGQAALEEAARTCEDVRSCGDSFKPFEDNHDDGHADGCNNCAAAIRALSTQTGPKGVK